MRLDQFERLQKRAEELTEILISEIDPAQWPGEGVDWSALEREQAVQLRGDRYWCKKNASATLSVLTRLHSVIGMGQRALAAPNEDEPKSEVDIDAEIRNAEKEAKKAIDEAMKRRNVVK